MTQERQTSNPWPFDCERLIVDVPIPGTKDAKGAPLTQRLVMRRTQAALILQHNYNARARECFAERNNAYQSVK